MQVQMGHDAFHRLLLEGGELPFHLIEKRLRRRDADQGLPRPPNAHDRP